MTLGRVASRTVIGGLFVGHGTQKLFGWFGGSGIDGTAQFLGSIGLRPAKAHAVAAGVTEAGGGALLALGALTPLPSAALIATMLTAIRTVHGANGPWATSGGWEYNAVLIAALLALAEGDADDDGSGTTGTALLALGLGLAGAVGAKVVSDRFPEPEPATDTTPAA